MTKQDLIKAFTMKVNGYKTEIIADEIGVTAGCLSKALHSVITNKNTKQSVYPKLNEFMLVNGYNATEMSELLQVNNSTFADFIKGRTKPYDLIVKVIKLTGFTFEEIFLFENEVQEE